MTESLFRLLLKLTVDDPVAELLAESVYSFRVRKSLFSVKILVFARNGGEGNGGGGLDFHFHLQAALEITLGSDGVSRLLIKPAVEKPVTEPVAWSGFSSKVRRSLFLAKV